ncbi:hypothetical protein BDN71DRAFT_197746 [Pleurotus eryngii]|uniref:Transmembrane protein n=1 Tax=Pleurotus eryngii TaxID=5323 RepID=A0A9P6D2S5_PLEER|nr:hypothetical protein BDN71DRAFT_197746 [Pleurotus eryngii]
MRTTSWEGGSAGARQRSTCSNVHATLHFLGDSPSPPPSPPPFSLSSLLLVILFPFMPVFLLRWYFRSLRRSLRPFFPSRQLREVVITHNLRSLLIVRPVRPIHPLTLRDSDSVPSFPTSRLPRGSQRGRVITAYPVYFYVASIQKYRVLDTRWM